MRRKFKIAQPFIVFLGLKKVLYLLQFFSFLMPIAKSSSSELLFSLNMVGSGFCCFKGKIVV